MTNENPDLNETKRVMGVLARTPPRPHADEPKRRPKPQRQQKKPASKPKER